MPWSVSINAVHPFVETIYTGILTARELVEAARETLSLAHEKGITLILADCTALKGGHTVFDLYELADEIRTDDFIHAIKEAVVIPEEERSREMVKFWETTCANRGIAVEAFSDRQRAIDWLLAP